MRLEPMEALKDIILTLSFLSRIPIGKIKMDFSHERIRKTPAYFTLVGYLPGFIYFLTAIFRDSIPIKILGLSISFYLFDLFHFDGLLDTLDGFLNQSSKERRLQIMSRGNVGPFAVFYGILYVIAFYETFQILEPIDYLYGSVFGRYAMVILIFSSKPAKEEGLGALLFPTERSNLLKASLFPLPLLILSPIKFSISFAIAILLAYTIKKLSETKIDGITGDVMGGTCLIAQIIILLSLSTFY